MPDMLHNEKKRPVNKRMPGNSKRFGTTKKTGRRGRANSSTVQGNTVGIWERGHRNSQKNDQRTRRKNKRPRKKQDVTGNVSPPTPTPPPSVCRLIPLFCADRGTTVRDLCDLDQDDDLVNDKPTSSG